eukprot:jgi/Botrbrau1/21034/Bobra.0144s0045.1
MGRLGILSSVLMVDSLDYLSLVHMVTLLDGVIIKCLELSPALESSKWSGPPGACLKLCLTFRQRPRIFLRYVKRRAWQGIRALNGVELQCTSGSTWQDKLGRSPIFTRDAGRESLSKPHHLARLCNNGRRARETAVHVRAYAYAPVLGLQPVVSFSLAKLVANVLGYGVLVGSCVRSAPQIIKILKGQSALGLSVSAQIMELLTYNVTVAYNVRLGYHFVTYGESFDVLASGCFHYVPHPAIQRYG